MANLTRILHRVADPLSTSCKTSSITLGPHATTTFLDFRSKSQPLVIRARFRCLHHVKQDHSPPKTTPKDQSKYIPGRPGVDEIPRPAQQISTPLLILQRIALAYLLSISACLAYAGVPGAEWTRGRSRRPDTAFGFVGCDAVASGCYEKPPVRQQDQDWMLNVSSKKDKLRSRTTAM
jgi:hypothetical protein